MIATLAPRLRDFTDELRARWEEHEFSPAARRATFYAALVAFGALWGAVVSVVGVAGLLLCACVVAVAFILRDFRAGVVLLILVLPISGSNFFPHELFGITGMNPLNLLFAATLAVLVMNLPGERARPRLLPRPAFWLMVVPMVVGGLMGMNHVDEIPGSFLHADQVFFDTPGGYLRDMLVKPLFMVLFAMLVSAAVYRSRKVEPYLAPAIISIWSMVLLVMGFIVVADVDVRSLAGEYARHVLSPLGLHANDLGRMYAVAYGLLLFTWDRTMRPGLKLALFLSMGAVVAGLLLTFSRGAFLGFIVVNVIYLFSRRKAKTLMMAGLAIPIGVIFMPGALLYRLEMGFGHGADAVSAGRIDGIWLPLLPELFDSPIWGKGLGAIMWSRAMVADAIHNASHPHNAYLQAFMDHGIVGLVLLTAFWIWAWRAFRRMSRDERVSPDMRGFFEGAAAGLLSFLIAGMAGSSLKPVPEQCFLWLALGLLWGVQSRIERESRKDAKADPRQRHPANPFHANGRSVARP